MIKVHIIVTDFGTYHLPFPLPAFLARPVSLILSMYDEWRFS